MGGKSARIKKTQGNGCGCLISVLAFAALLFAIFLGVSQPSFSLAATKLSARDTYYTYYMESDYTPLEATAIPASSISASIATPELPVQSKATANDVANLRQGPGTDFAVLGTAQIGQSLTVVGRNAAGDWYQLDSGHSIAAFLVDDAPTVLPVVSQ